MRIGFLSQPFDVVEPPVDGRYSIPMLTFNFMRKLAARGHDVTIYATSVRTARHSDERNWLVSHGIVQFSRPRRLSRLAMAVLRRLGHLGGRQLPFMVTSWFDPLYPLQAALNARSRGLEVIHIQNFSQYVPLFRAVCPEIKIVLHMHCEWLNQIDRATIRARLRQVDRILCTSEYIRERAAQVLPEFATRMATLFNGVDVERFTPEAEPVPRNESRSVYFIGRIAPDKGVHLLIEAFERVVEAIPGARLCLAGSPELLSKDLYEAYDDAILRAIVARFYDTGDDASRARSWQESLKRVQLDRIEFLGELSHSELIERLRSAALLVQPSIVPEAFGLPVAEAMAMGLPVIATRGGALPEIVEQGVTGLIVERGSVESLAEAMIELLRSPAKRHVMGVAGRRRALERFGFADLARQLEHHYAVLLRPPGQARQNSSTV